MQSHFSIATWNINSLRVRLPHVLNWLSTTNPDVLALQELKMPTEDFPFDDFKNIGYEALVNGQKTYNGVAILYKKHFAKEENISHEFSTLADPQRRVLAATIHNIRIINLYVPNGESLDSPKFIYKLDWLNHLKAFLKQELSAHSKVVVVGDFNIAPGPLDVHKPERWEGKVLYSEAERNLFQTLLELGFHDSFRELNPTDQSYSRWDYRLMAFQRNWGLRIDHILGNANLMKNCEKCIIDRTPREWDRPSDHTPVIATFRA